MKVSAAPFRLVYPNAHERLAPHKSREWILWRIHESRHHAGTRTKSRSRNGGKKKGPALCRAFRVKRTILCRFFDITVLVGFVEIDFLDLAATALRTFLQLRFDELQGFRLGQSLDRGEFPHHPVERGLIELAL